MADLEIEPYVETTENTGETTKEMPMLFDLEADYPAFKIDNDAPKFLDYFYALEQIVDYTPYQGSIDSPGFFATPEFNPYIELEYLGTGEKHETEVIYDIGTECKFPANCNPRKVFQVPSNKVFASHMMRISMYNDITGSDILNGFIKFPMEYLATIPNEDRYITMALNSDQGYTGNVEIKVCWDDEKRVLFVEVLGATELVVVVSGDRAATWWGAQCLLLLLIWIFIVGFIFNQIETTDDGCDEQFENYWLCLWFVLVTLLTVGYGDMYPCTTGGRYFNGVIILINLCALGYVLTKATDFIISMIESFWGLFVVDQGPQPRFAEGDPVLYCDKRRNWKAGIITEVKTLTNPILFQYKLKTDSVGDIQTHPEQDLKEYDPPTVEDCDSDFWDYLKVAGVKVVVTLVVFTILFRIFEDPDEHSWADCFHFTVCTLTTVGYGDWAPTNGIPKIACCFLIFGGITLLTSFAGNIMGYVSKRAFLEVACGHLSNAGMSAKQLLEYDANGDGEIDRYEYVTASLVMCNFCDTNAIDMIMAKFNQIDADGSGEIDMEDFRAAAAAKEAREAENSTNAQSGLSFL